MSSQIIADLNKCSYHNCGRSAIKYFVTTKKWCCEKNAKLCPANKAAQEKTILAKYGCKNVSLSTTIIAKKKIRYLTLDWNTINKKRRDTCVSRYGSENVSQVPFINKKRNKTFNDIYGSHPLSTKDVISLKKDTMVRNHGVDNYGKTETHKKFINNYYKNLPEEVIRERIDKILHTKLELGLITDPASKCEFDRYYADVRNLSDRNYKKHKSIINPCNFSRGRTSYHLDHIFSIKDGFENSVPVNVISHYTNLQIMKYDENIAKGGLSDKTLIELFENYRNS